MSRKERKPGWLASIISLNQSINQSITKVLVGQCLTKLYHKEMGRHFAVYLSYAWTDFDDILHSDGERSTQTSLAIRFKIPIQGSWIRTRIQKFLIRWNVWNGEAMTKEHCY